MPSLPTPPDSEPKLVESSTSEQLPGENHSFIPPPPPSNAPPTVLRIRTNRYGDLEEHELVRLLDTIQDERSRARFRESIYISLFFWLAVAWFLIYGPRVLWHAPQLINPADAIRKQELTELNAPVIPPPIPHPKSRFALDKEAIKRLQDMTQKEPTPPPPTPAPEKVTPAPPPPVATAKPTPRVPNAPIPEAPTPQRQASQPNFNAGNPMQQSMRESRSGDSGGANGPMMPTRGGANVGGGVSILSDTQGVDFSEYLRRLKDDVYRNWIPLLPEETEPPIMKQGETYIVFTIYPDGRFGDMHLVASSHDVAIDKAAWGSIVSEGQFPPLPSKFHGPGLTLRFHYVVNKGIGQ